jgi:AraC-like DNA-binding protein
MGDGDHHQGDQEPGPVASSTATGTATGGHLSRQFRRAYGESPYAYLMTRRIERAMALLRRGDRSVTEVCFAVGCSSLGTFSTRFTELVGMPPSLPASGGAGGGGAAVVRGETGDQTGQESRSAAPRAAANVTAMDLTIHASFLPHDDPPAAGQAHSTTSFIAR